MLSNNAAWMLQLQMKFEMRKVFCFVHREVDVIKSEALLPWHEMKANFFSLGKKILEKAVSYD